MPASGQGIQIRTSTDRIHWSSSGKVWSPAPVATNQFTNTTDGPLWAPDCTYIDGTFHVSVCYRSLHGVLKNITLTFAQLFYAASTSGSRNSGIFYATSTTGQPGSFQDHGLILSTNDSDLYNAIDPKCVFSKTHMYMVTDMNVWSAC